MLEVDEDSRLGRELIAGGTKYHAHFVPDEDMMADFYEEACEELNCEGIRQYEISNFARAGQESRHNLKYWTRQPYLGFGVDAHSMLSARDSGMEAVRFSSPDSLEDYVAGGLLKANSITWQAALEETFFLGLRLNDGVDLDELERKFGIGPVSQMLNVIDECVGERLINRQETRSSCLREAGCCRMRFLKGSFRLGKIAFYRDERRGEGPCGANTLVRRF